LEAAARHRKGAVGTVGEIAVRPGAKNVVPGEAVFSVDVRAADPRARAAVLRQFRQATRLICDARQLRSSLDVLGDVPPTALDPGLREVLRRAAAAAGVADAPVMVSGAGHDAQNSQLAGVPTGMLFVRSQGGSHSPREYCAIDDAALGATALAQAIAELAGAGAPEALEDGRGGAT
ncbi:MAG: M20/M25/M40 family metallo-hydrolase, partial [Candidatus Limnocylindria bacterium]